MLNVPFDVNFEKQLIKKEAEECWENLMEYATGLCTQRISGESKQISKRRILKKYS